MNEGVSQGKEKHCSALTAGVDEVGRGALAGDVFAAAVILDKEKSIDGLKDSKQLSEKQRANLYHEIKEEALCFSIGRANVLEIDSLNILQASLLAMSRAVKALSVQPKFVLVDGLHVPEWNYSAKAIVRGDSKVMAIAAASIVAKVTRDKEMALMGQLYPGYDFAKNKGYPTQSHLTGLKKVGPCIVHRRSFAPVSKLLG